MANSNRQYKDSAKLTWYGFLGALLIAICLTLCGCYGTLYLTDAEYSDAREENASITYYNNQIYWGWSSGYYYYYGKPHYYPWNYYYSTCPPSHYHTTTHIIINKPVNRPIHRPNRSIHIKEITNERLKQIRRGTKSNNKVIIKSNNGSKRTNKTTIRRKTKK